MKKTLQVFLMLAAAAGLGRADTVVVDFASLAAPVNLALPGGSIVNNVRFEYDPQGATPLCNFDAGASGLQYPDATHFPNGCVGAQADAGGLFGTTDGVLSVSFLGALAADQLHFLFGISSFLPAPTDPASVGAVFSLAGVINASQTALFDPDLGFGSLDYSGPAFDHVDLFFFPADLGPNGEVGQTSFLAFDMNYTEVPEPGQWLMLGSAMLTMGWMLKRKRA